MMSHDLAVILAVNETGGAMICKNKPLEELVEDSISVVHVRICGVIYVLKTIARKVLFMAEFMFMTWLNCF